MPFCASHLLRNQYLPCVGATIEKKNELKVSAGNRRQIFDCVWVFDGWWLPKSAVWSGVTGERTLTSWGKHVHLVRISFSGLLNQYDGRN